jgi:hypothetical protein
MAELTPCEYARQRHRDMARWRNLWTILLFSFGSSVILFLSVSTLLFLRESWLPAALTTLGAIVSGVGVKWVVDRRRESVEEEVAAYEYVKQICDAGVAKAALEDVKARFSLVGRAR